jgi:hypothetical protein
VERLPLAGWAAMPTVRGVGLHGTDGFDVDTAHAWQAPAFAAGFAVQQLLELLDPILDTIPKGVKKTVLGVVALGIGVLLGLTTEIRVLEPLGVAGDDAFDIGVTALVVSAGTQGLNSIMKFLGYAKEAKKGAAKHNREEAGLTGEAPLDRI